MGLEACFSMGSIAERLVCRMAAAAKADPLAFGDLVIVAVFVRDGYRARNAQGTVLPNLDIDVCHFNSSITKLVLDRWAGRSKRYASYRE